MSRPRLGAAMLALGCALAGCSKPDDGSWISAAHGPRGTAMNPLDPALHLLPVGATAPAIEAEGWLNGAPAKSAKLVVLDIWADWCPVCRVTAPGLVTAHDKFKSRGVEFVSLTDLPEATVSRFVWQFGISWPAGYGAAKELIQKLGVHRPDQTGLGVDLAPVLYLIGPDGGVIWCDAAARYRHQDTNVWLSEVQSQIEKSLAELP